MATPIDEQRIGDFQVFIASTNDANFDFQDFLQPDAILNESFIYNTQISEHPTDSKSVLNDTFINDPVMIQITFIVSDRPSTLPKKQVNTVFVGDESFDVSLDDEEREPFEVEIPYTTFRSDLFRSQDIDFDTAPNTFDDFQVGGDISTGLGILKKTEKTLLVRGFEPSNRIERTIRKLKEWRDEGYPITTNTFLEKGQLITRIESMSWTYGPDDGSTCTFIINLKEVRFFELDVGSVLDNSQFVQLRTPKKRGGAGKVQPTPSQADKARSDKERRERAARGET